MKTNIIIIVQDSGEPGHEFAERLEKICEELRTKHKIIHKLIDPNSIERQPKVAFMTTASDGRQTATIQFFTNDKTIKR